MTSFRIRPIFEVHMDEDYTEVQSKIKEKANVHDTVCTWGIDTHLVVGIKVSKRHFWSPQCSLNFEKTEDGKLSIRGLYGPNPNIWFLFVFGYGVCLTLMMFIGIIGFSQYSLGNPAGILWVLPVLGAIVVALYVASQFGQKLGAEQTFAIHYFLQEALGVKFELN
jgi:hypothetical protein